MLRRLLTRVLILLCLTHPVAPVARAWKIDVHIWIGNEILRDARDGRLVFNGFSGSFAMNARAVSALRAHPQAFLLGCIGPDALPDVVSGQLVIHPAIPGGWGTAEWLRHLMAANNLTDEELAYALGYHVHAASDVFAHTFVNRYAGDLFELQRHETSALRHINIESFVSNFLPPMRTADGRIVSPVDAVRTPGTLRIPTSLMQRQVFLNADAIAQLRRSGSAPHLVAAYDLHRSLDKALGPNGALTEVDALIIKLASEALLGIPVADGIAKELAKVEGEFRDRLNDAAEDVGDLAQDVNERIGRIQGLQYEIAEKGILLSVNLASEYLRIQGEIASKGIEVANLANKLSGLPQQLASNVCNKVPFIGGLVCFAVKISNPQYLIVERALAEAQRALDRLQRIREDLKPKVRDAIKTSFRLINDALKARVELTNIFIAYAAQKPFSPAHRRAFEIWRDNIPVALTEYARANSDVMLNSIDPSRPSVTEPLKRWLICYGPTFVAVPSALGRGVCTVWQSVDAAKAEIDTLEHQLASLSPLTQAAMALKDELTRRVADLQGELTGVVVTEGLSAFDNIANTNSLLLYKAIAEKVDDGALNSMMVKDLHGEGLLSIPDAAARIRSEMHLTGGVLDPDRFVPLRNAIVLSKLALLDASTLNQLASVAGVRETLFGRELYGANTASGTNILYGFVRSIDGNHQWQDVAPPHPRVTGADMTDFGRRAGIGGDGYGYSDFACPRDRGMRMWADTAARARLFKRLFAGHIAPGVDSPKVLGAQFGSVLPDGYPLPVGGDGWEEDGKAIAAPYNRRRVALLIEGDSIEGSRVEVSIRDSVVFTQVVDSTRRVSFRVEVEIGFDPEFVTAAERGSGRIADRQVRFRVGCAGATGGSVLAVMSEIRVVKGDNLWNLSKEQTGRGARYPELIAANQGKIRDEDLIYPGQVFASPWRPNLRITVP